MKSVGQKKEDNNMYTVPRFTSALMRGRTFQKPPGCWRLGGVTGSPLRFAPGGMKKSGAARASIDFEKYD